MVDEAARRDDPGESARGTPEGPRERGWGRVLLVLVLFLMVPLSPLRLLLPVEDMLLLLVPACAVCTIVGWMRGGRLGLMLLWVVVAVAVLLPRLSAGVGMAESLTAGWSLFLAAAFGAGALLGSKEAPGAFLPRALGAIGLGLVLATSAVFAIPDGATRLGEVVHAEYQGRLQESLDNWRKSQALPEWKAFADANPDWVTVMQQGEQQLPLIARRGEQLFPALLALESLVALALAWALYHRIGRARVGPPLSRVREFRFDDQLVWGFILGLAIVVIPGLEEWRLVGFNLLAFFGMLYAARGFGVLVWLLAPGRIVTVLLVLFAAFFWYVVGPLALGLGVGDTWLDWRTRAGRKS